MRCWRLAKWFGRTLVGALALASTAVALGAPRERDAVDALVAQVGADPSTDALARIGAERHWDPWLVAERLREVAGSTVASRYVGVMVEPPPRLGPYVAGAAPLIRDAARDALIDEALGHLASKRSGKGPMEGLRAAALAAPAGTVRALELQLLAARCQIAGGDLDEGFPALEATARAAEQLGWVGGARAACVSSLRAARPVGRLLIARRAAETLLGLQAAERDVEGLAQTTQDLAQISHLMGDTGGAVRQLTEAIEAYEQLGLGARSERARQIRLIWYATLGQFQAAADDYERLVASGGTRGDPHRAALLDLDWANVLWLLGDHARAIEATDRAQSALASIEVARDRGTALGTRGNVLRQAGRWIEALASHEQALAVLTSSGEVLFAAQARVGIAEALLDGVRAQPLSTNEARGNDERVRRARAAAEVAVEVFARASAAAHRLSAQETLAKTLEAAGQHDDARVLLTEVLAECQALGLHRLAQTCRLDLARLFAADGRWIEAGRTALEGLVGLRDVEGGQAQQQNDRSVAMRADLQDLGARAGAERSDAGMLHTSLELGRSMALLSAFGGRSAALRAVVRNELLAALATARAAKVEALSRYLAARSTIGGGASERWKEYQERRASEAALLDRVRAEEAMASDRLAPHRPILLDELRLRLAELSDSHLQGEGAPAAACYLALNLQADVGHALVATRDETRLVIYGTEEMVRLRAALTSLLASLVPHDEDVPPTPDAAALRAIADTLLPPLRLPEGPVRLLISPDRELAFVPFALVLPERIRPVFVPSATVLDVLMRTRFATGTGVLACGDPDYKVKDLEGRGVALRGAPRLLALRNSRAEVEAVTPDRTVDGRLLGQAFTERGLARALTDGTAGAPPGPPRRRRALLLSCHGLLDVERPALSALALTPGDGEDGYLTAVEVLRLPVHADLVVLSACQTGRGRFVRGEGVMGLARAFMHAGAPRVVVSLWNVDDEATAFLMARLHELWRTGKVGLSDALQQAQRLTREHVFERTVAPAGQPARAEKKAWWADPAYWAPWVIWGLPD